MSKPIIWTDEFWEDKDDYLILASCLVRAGQTMSQMRHRFTIVDRVRKLLSDRLSPYEGKLKVHEADKMLARAMIFCRQQGASYWMRKSEERGTWQELGLDDIMIVIDVMSE